MLAHEAQQTLAKLEGVKSDSRSVISQLWFPLILFGCLLIVSAPFSLLWDGGGLGLFWLVGAPVGIVIVSRHYRLRGMSIGAEVSGAPYIALSVALVVACFATGALGGALDLPTLSALGPPLSVALAYLGFAYLERSGTLAAVAVALGVAAVAIHVAAVPHKVLVSIAVYGVVLVLTGLALREKEATAR